MDAAIGALVAADAKRGITTTAVSVDDPALGAAAVSTVLDPAQNKAAVDAIFNRTMPDYLMILGSSDVIPHQDLTDPCNGGTDDPDAIAFGDLPYACAGAYSKSEREGVFIATSQGEFLLRRRGGNPFYDPELVKLVGKMVVCEGQMLNEFTLCVSDTKVVS